MKITQKVSFNFASEASYEFQLWGQIVLPDRSILIGQKLMENVKLQKFNFGNFKTLCRDHESFDEAKNTW